MEQSKNNIWIEVDELNSFTKTSNYLVISYIPDEVQIPSDFLESKKKYAQKIEADFIVLSGRTQKYDTLEIFRIKKFVEQYDRSIFVDFNVLIKEDCPNLFDIVPKGKIGIRSDLELFKNFPAANDKTLKRRMLLLKSEHFAKVPYIMGQVHDAIIYECDLIDTHYDIGVIVCDKEHANIFSPIEFNFRANRLVDQLWIETLIHRIGHDVFNLDDVYNYEIGHAFAKEIKIDEAKVIQYPNRLKGPGFFMTSVFNKDTKNTWIEDNCITGYKDKEPIDSNKFDILCLGHSEEQFATIKKNPFTRNFNLNDIDEDQSFSESRIYRVDFDTLFNKDAEYVGIVTASWNLKYCGINPIDEIAKWQAIRELNKQSVICANAHNSKLLTHIEHSVISIVCENITNKQIEEMFDLFGIEKIFRTTVISNQIITHRENLKKLFDFYENNDILDKIKFFVNKNGIVSRSEKNKKRLLGYFAELVTAYWFANQNYLLMPQEVMKENWY